jgi:DNA-binding transcriptional LysR family regulator
MLLNRIQLFLTVAKHQNIGKTAREMHVSASSVCQRLKSLENDFGVKLYKKSKRGIQLTGAGQTLFTTGSDILSDLQNLRKRLNSDSEIAVQSLSVGGTYNPSARFLPSAIATFQKTHPDVKVRFVTSDLVNLEKALRNFEVDIAIMQSPSASSDLEMEHFAVDNLTFFVHPTHPLAKKQKLDLEDLTDTPLIVREGRHTTHKLLQHLRHRGLIPNIALRCASPDAVKAAVRRKMGIGILFYNLIEEDIKRRNLKPIKFSGLKTFAANSYIVYNKKKPLLGAASDFLALLRSMKTRVRNPVNRRQVTKTDRSYDPPFSIQ